MLKVLIVDDDFMVADCLEEILLAAGYEVCGIAGGVADALMLDNRHEPDLAVIDFHLQDDEYGTEVGAALCERRTIGVLYVSGNADDPRLHDAKGTACIAKPYSASSIVAALRMVSERTFQGADIAELPQGFWLRHALLSSSGHSHRPPGTAAA
jgi:DNA-binding response OmpR family regulator